jgi:AcrR family transcriptional regulator
MIDLTAEHGFKGLTIRRLTRTSGVSTRTFYTHFPNVDECFASTYRAIMSSARGRVSNASSSGAGRAETLRSGVRAAMEEIAENPRAAHLALVESFDAGPAMLNEMKRATRGFEEFLQAGFEPTLEADSSALLAHGLVAGIERVARTKLGEGRHRELPAIAGELADWILSISTSEPGPQTRSKRAPVPNSSCFPTFDQVGGERGRILAAVTKLAARHGYWALTIPMVRRAAGVSRRAFDAQFDGPTEPFLEAVSVLGSREIARAARRGVGAKDPRQGLTRAVGALCAALDRNPAIARLCLVEVLATGRAGLECQERLVSTAATYLGRLASPHFVPRRAAAEASAAAGWNIAQATRANRKSAQLPLLVTPVLLGAIPNA